MHTGITPFSTGKLVGLWEIFRFWGSKILGSISKRCVNHRLQQHGGRMHLGDPVSLTQWGRCPNGGLNPGRDPLPLLAVGRTARWSWGDCAGAGPWRRSRSVPGGTGWGHARQKERLSRHTANNRSWVCFREPQFRTLFRWFLVTELVYVGSESVKYGGFRNRVLFWVHLKSLIA